MTEQIELIVNSANTLYSNITSELLQQSSKKYNNDLLDLEQLDSWRNKELPQVLASRNNESKKAWLTIDELILLMDWKLAKGKFRPTLPKLIKSNSSEDVIDVTTRGFQILLDYVNEQTDHSWKDAKETRFKEYIETMKKAFKVFCELRGVGPATASLIMSLITKIAPGLTPPFFSDESFLYYVVDAKRPGSKIKYNLKEYTDELLPVYFSILRKHPEQNMDVLEKGAWALKMYEIYRVDKLANIKYDGLEEYLAKYDQEVKEEAQERVKEEEQQDVKKEKQPGKRKSSTKNGPVKKRAKSGSKNE